MKKRFVGIHVKPLPGPWRVWEVELATTHFTKAEAMERALRLQKRHRVKHIGVETRRGPRGAFSVKVVPPIVAEVRE